MRRHYRISIGQTTCVNRGIMGSNGWSQQPIYLDSHRESAEGCCHCRVPDLQQPAGPASTQESQKSNYSASESFKDSMSTVSVWREVVRTVLNTMGECICLQQIK